MQIIYEMFMLVAEEMSIKRAAERACVSQQCVSDHVKRLEKHYSIELFSRKPRFKLTEAGQVLQHSLQRIRAIEQSTQKELEQWSAGKSGCFTMGISASRAQIVLPWVLPAYYREFPQVEISFIMDDTVILEEKLLQGKIDLLFGVNTHSNPLFESTQLCQDEICLVISDGLLEKKFGAAAERILSAKIDLQEFQDVPFIMSNYTGAIDSSMQKYLDEKHIMLHAPYHISDTDTQLSLCAKGLCASLNPRMLLSNIAEHNRHCSSGEFIHVLPLEGYHDFLRIELVSLRETVKPLYFQEFQRQLITAIRKNYCM